MSAWETVFIDFVAIANPMIGLQIVFQSVSTNLNEIEIFMTFLLNLDIQIVKNLHWIFLSKKIVLFNDVENLDSQTFVQFIHPIMLVFFVITSEINNGFFGNFSQISIQSKSIVDKLCERHCFLFQPSFNNKS